MLRTSDLEYELPDDLIATEPARRRDAAKLMVVDRAGDAPPTHRTVADLPALLRPGDLLVINTTKVIPARFIGRRKDTGGRVEGLFLDGTADGNWSVYLKSNGKLRAGITVILHSPHDQSVPSVEITLREKQGDQWLIQCAEPGEPAVILDRIGATPLPPYIPRARGQRGMPDAAHRTWSDALDRDWYQTVYADDDAAGAVAAPTAGLHFTPGLLAELGQHGIDRADVILHVGAGTFKPIQTEYVESHPMHTERYHVPAKTLHALRQARLAGSRIIAVGTTTARALESLPNLDGRSDINTETRLLITPGYEFRHFDGLLTNFHLPRSTLLAMVGALFTGGIDRLLTLYDEAIAEQYRFYSFGDAMLILPSHPNVRP
ncbi:MAG: tRNA preQ1(34) S-adenosylmethionine ribosyltransferase-isomerase QueA [Phycisphaerales bacterium]|nr:tRNA preQ1(34) S-adenosylmethionine ribosyltransferase-isomerase QueA [Phycisphaerales bacterium]